jgi:hypothetical protein
LIFKMEGRSGVREAAPGRTKNLTRNEKDRERRRVGGAHHAQALADKQAEIDHLQGSLTGVNGGVGPDGELQGGRGYHPRLPEDNRALG